MCNCSRSSGWSPPAGPLSTRRENELQEGAVDVVSSGLVTAGALVRWDLWMEEIKGIEDREEGEIMLI